MRSTWAIARLSIQAAIRSRLVIILVIALGLLIFLLPLNLEHDGTVEGYIRIVLVYTLGTARFLLSIMAVWMGCLAISGDIEDKRIHLLTTKPVSSAQLWLGRWLGITLLLGGLLICTGIVTVISLQWATKRLCEEMAITPKAQADIFVARRRLQAVPPDYRSEAEKLLETRQAEGLLPNGIDRQEALETIAESIRMEYSTLDNNEYARWLFDVPRFRSAERPLLLEYSFTAPEKDPEPLAITWVIGTEQDPAIYQATVMATPGGVYTLDLPVELSSLDERILVQCVNTADNPVTIVFPRPGSVVLLQYAGHFSGNFSRGMMMLFLHIAFLAAVGVTAGACFSTPVAAFVALWVVIMIGLGGVIERLSQARTFFDISHHGPAQSPGVIDHILHYYFQGLHFVFSPFRSINTLEMLATNQLIEWTTLLRYSVSWLVIGCGALALLGTWILNHREMALQT